MSRFPWRLCAFASSLQHPAVARPVETRPRIALPPGGHIAVPDDVPDRVARLERAREGGKPPVLRVRERCFARAFELDADGKIIAMRAPLPARLARVPRAPAARHELVEIAVASNQEVSGNFRAGDRRIKRVRGGVKPVGE